MDVMLTNGAGLGFRLGFGRSWTSGGLPRAEFLSRYFGKPRADSRQGVEPLSIPLNPNFSLLEDHLQAGAFRKNRDASLR